MQNNEAPKIDITLYLSFSFLCHMMTFDLLHIKTLTKKVWNIQSWYTMSENTVNLSHHYHQMFLRFSIFSSIFTNDILVFIKSIATKTHILQNRLLNIIKFWYLYCVVNIAMIAIKNYFENHTFFISVKGCSYKKRKNIALLNCIITVAAC